MSTLRRTIASVSLAMLVATFTLVAPVQAATYDDVPASHWAYEAAEKFAKDGILDSGSSAKNFNPAGKVNRAQIVKIVLGAAGITAGEPSKQCFPDVPRKAWYEKYVCEAATRGIVGGYPDGTFKPERLVNRAEATKIVVNAFGLVQKGSGADTFSDVRANDWFAPFVGTAYYYSIVNGNNGQFRPGDTINRGEMIVMAFRAQNPTPRASATPKASATPAASGSPAASATPTPAAKSKAGVTVKISANTPKSTTVTNNANAVPLVSIDFTAGSEDAVELDSLSFKRKGVGATSDWSGLYIYDGNKRLTNSRTISTDDHMAEFNGLGVTIAAGTTKQLTLRGDVAGATANNKRHSFSIDAASWVKSNAKATNGSFPMGGNEIQIGSQSSGELTITKSGNPSTPKVGASQAIIGQFKMEATNEDIKIKHLAILQNGTINRGDVSNLKLYNGTKLLAEVAGIDKEDLIQFDLGSEGHTIKDGSTDIFQVKADLKGKAGETTILYFEEDADVLADGLDFGFGVTVDRGDASGDSGSYDGSGTNSTSLTLEGGQITLSYQGPSAENISKDGKDVVLLKFNLTSDRNVDVKQLQVRLESVGSSADTGTADDQDLWMNTDGEGNLKDIRIVELKDDGSRKTHMGPKELTAESGSVSDILQDLTYTDTFTVKAGETKKMAITADIDNNAATDDQFRASLLAISTTAGIKDVDTNKFVTDIVPTATIQGSTHTVQAAGVTISLASSTNSRTVVRGTNGQEIVTFNAAASDAEDITITEVTLKAVIDNNEGTATDWSAGSDTESSTTATAVNILQNVELYDGSTKISKNPKSPNSSTGLMTFTGLDWKIPSGQTRSLTVKANLGKNARAGVVNDLVGIIIDTATYVTAQDEGGDDVTPTLSPSGGPNSNSGTWATASPNVFITVAQAGTLTASAPPIQVEDQTVLGNAKNVKLAEFKLKALDEDFVVKKLTLNVGGTNPTKAVKQLVIKYPTKAPATTGTKPALDGSSMIAVTSGASSVTFDGIKMMVPRDNDNVRLEVYADFQEILETSTAGAATGDSIQISYKSTTSASEFEAVGNGSGDTINDSDGSSNTSNIAGNTAYLRKSVPTVTYVGTSGSILFANDADVAKIKITADAAGSIDVYQIEFFVSPNGVATDSSTGIAQSGGWSILDTRNLNTTLATATYASNVVRFTFNNSGGNADVQTIDTTGTTFQVRGPIKEDTLEATKAVIAIKITQDTSAATTAAATTVAAGGAAVDNFIWSDRSKASHSTTTTDWTNGYKISIPTDYFFVQ